jgi:hypothetical protein
MKFNETDDFCIYVNQNSERAEIMSVQIRRLKKSEKLGYGLHIRTSEIQDFGAD